MGTSAITALMEYLISNQHQIVDDKSDFDQRTQTIGFFEKDNKNQYCVRLLNTAFKNFCANQGYQSHLITAKSLKEDKHFIQENSERIARQESSNGTRIGAFYKLLVPKEYYGDFTYIKADSKKTISFMDSAQQSMNQNNSNNEGNPFNNIESMDVNNSIDELEF